MDEKKRPFIYQQELGLVEGANPSQHGKLKKNYTHLKKIKRVKFSYM